MLRRATLAFFALAFALCSCGRQVTPERVNSDLSGEMSITFEVGAPMDFTNVNYLIAFNTSGVGKEPYAEALSTGTLCDYSFVFEIGANQGSIANPYLYQVYIQPGQSFLSKNYVQLEPGSYDVTQPQSNEFTLTFSRSQFNLTSPVNPGDSECPDQTASPSPSPISSGSPAPSPGPTNLYASTWYINLITTNPAGMPLDALGYGATDVQYQLSLDVDDADSITQSRTPGVTPPNLPAAFITGFSIINTP